MRFYISDLHFYHAAMNEKMDKRGFADVQCMNEYIVSKWNARVGKKDQVVILGDFSFGNATETNEILERINGQLYLIRGNHDRFLNYRKTNLDRFVWVKDYEEMHDNGRRVILSHYPIICYNGQYKLDKGNIPHTYMLYGHVHDTHDEKIISEFVESVRNTQYPDFNGDSRKVPCNMINCFCKYSDYEPLTLDEWIVLTERRRS